MRDEKWVMNRGELRSPARFVQTINRTAGDRSPAPTFPGRTAIRTPVGAATCRPKASLKRVVARRSRDGGSFIHYPHPKAIQTACSLLKKGQKNTPGLKKIPPASPICNPASRCAPPTYGRELLPARRNNPRSPWAFGRRTERSPVSEEASLEPSAANRQAPKNIHLAIV